MVEVNISFTLKTKVDISKEELGELLDDCCPLVLSKGGEEVFEISTEKWGVVK